MEFVWHIEAKKKTSKVRDTGEFGRREEMDERTKERRKMKREEKMGAPLRPPQTTSKNTPTSCTTNIDAISFYGQNHTLRRLACFQWLHVGVEGNQVEVRKEEGIEGEKES